MPRSSRSVRQKGVALLAALTLAASGCGDDADDSDGDSEPLSSELSAGIQDLVDLAREEGGELVLTWGQFNSPELFRDWEEDFEATYGIDLSISNSPNPNMNENASQVSAERENDRAASTDVLLATATHTGIARDGGASERVDWESLDGNVAALIEEHGEDVLDADGTAVPFVTVVFGITYNLDAIDEEDVPDEVEALTDLPEEVSIASTPQASNFELLAHEDQWGEDRLREWFDDFAGRVDGLIPCIDVSRLASGEFDILAIDCGKRNVDAANAQGANLGWKVLQDAAIVDYVHPVPMVHAPHPATAKLFVDYLVSPSAQEILREYEYVDLHHLDGSIMSELIAEAETDGIELTERSSELIEANPELNSDVRPDLIAIFEQRGGS